MANPKNPGTNGSKREPKKRKKRSAWKIVGITSLVVLGVLVTGTGVGAAYVMNQIKNAPPLDLNQFTTIEATTFVYDRNNQLLGQTQADGNRELIKNLSDVSPYVVNAFISGEDKNFYHHMGINPLAMLRAAVQNFTGHGIVSGASTITQQTVKNVVFPEQNRTLQRKLQEAYLAVELEQSMSKNEIMTTYLNWIYFGKSKTGVNLYGIQAASKEIFGVPANKLNLAQAALLASLPNNPANLNPFTNLPEAIKRQNYILDQMRDNGYVTDQQLSDAKAFDIKSSLVKEETAGTNNLKHPYLLTEAEERAAEALLSTKQYDTIDDAKKALDRGGYKVYTTVDLKMQDAVQNVLASDKSFPSGLSVTITRPDGSKATEDEQAGATLIDNKTGGILAVGGGRNFTQDENNHTLMPRQPGSTMKPIAVYGPAVDKKIVFPGQGIDDVPTVWPGGSAGRYFPQNWDYKFHGLISIRTALEQSYNIPAIKVFQKLTPEVGLGYVKKMGVTTITNNDNHLPAAIGGLSQGISDEELTSAYTTFANQGVYKDSYLIDHIVDRRGNTIYQHQSKDTRVFSPETAFILTDMMKGVVQRGTAVTVGQHFGGKAIAGKTGTTDENKDAWFVGYTPDITLGIWTGYNTPHELLGNEGHRPLSLWNSMMDGIYPLMQNTSSDFPSAPPGVQKVTVCTLSGKLPTEADREYDKIYGGAIGSDWFTSDMLPSQSDDVIVKAKYIEVAGKKVLEDPKTPVGGAVKEGLFIKREAYTLPDNNPKYRPLDFSRELQSLVASSGDKTQNLVASPADLQVIPSTDNNGGIALTWSAVQGADGYVVLRSDASGQFQVISEVLTKPGFVDHTASPNTNYSYQVSSVVKGAIQAPGNTVTLSSGTQANPAGGSGGAGPSGLTASPGPVGPHLSWNPVSGALSYNIYRSQDGTNFDKIDTTNSTKYDDAQVVQGSGLTYEVTAVTAAGESSPSAAVTVNGSASGGGVPSAPAPSITNPHTGTELDLSWKGASGAASYLIERSTDGATWKAAGQTPSTSFHDTGLSKGTRYAYRLRTIDAQGNSSSPSQAVSGTP